MFIVAKLQKGKTDVRICGNQIGEGIKVEHRYGLTGFLVVQKMREKRTELTSFHISRCFSSQKFILPGTRHAICITWKTTDIKQNSCKR